MSDDDTRGMTVPDQVEVFRCPLCPSPRAVSTRHKLMTHINRHHSHHVFSADQLLLWGLDDCPKCHWLLASREKGLARHRCADSYELKEYDGDLVMPDGSLVPSWDTLDDDDSPGDVSDAEDDDPPAPTTSQQADNILSSIFHNSINISPSGPAPTVAAVGMRPPPLTPQRTPATTAPGPAPNCPPQSTTPRSPPNDTPTTPTPAPPRRRAPLPGPSARGSKRTAPNSAPRPRQQRPEKRQPPPGGCGADIKDLSVLLRYPAPRRVNKKETRAGVRECVGRLCRAFIQAPSAETLRPLILFPKLGYQAHCHLGRRALLRALSSYPDIPTPTPPPSGIPSHNRFTCASRMIGQGRLGAAARALEAAAPIAEATAETEAYLDKLHPKGHPLPFSHLKHPPNRPNALPFSEDDLMDAIRSFDRGTAAGPDGWCPPLVEVVSDLPDFRLAMLRLFQLVTEGKAPCRDLLCASSLTPLAKPGGGVRPIAVGSYFYRLIVKAALKAKDSTPALLETQFGVGTPGGVEPILHWIEDLVSKTADDDDPTYITFLDFENAFNSVSRVDMADAIKKHVPHLLALAEWSYGARTPLLSHPDRSLKPLRYSEEGIRQGDVAGPLFYSVTVRDPLEELARYIEQIIVAYLDDTATAGRDPDILDKIEEFLIRTKSSLRLNRRKSFTISTADIRANGVEILGSCVGPVERRRDFLSKRIDAEESKLQLLHTLSRQEALLLLRASLQLNLAHLLRSLDPTGLEDLWQRYDELLYDTVRTIRGPPAHPLLYEVDESLERELVTLPPRLGGLGVLSHVERIPAARSASRDSAHHLISSFAGVEEPDDRSPQYLRHQALVDRRFRLLLGKLNPYQTARIAENASRFGKAWIASYPTMPSLRLRDSLVSAGLCYRALGVPSAPVCTLCRGSTGWGHEDTCSNLQPSRTIKHEAIKNSLIAAFRSIRGVYAGEEPSIANRPGTFNDIRAAGPPGSEFVPVDIDVNSTSLARGDLLKILDEAASSDIALLPDPLLPYKQAINRALERAAREKYKKQPPATVDSFAFVPFIVSAGGTLADTGESALRSWQGTMTEPAFGALTRAISVALLQAREPRFGTAEGRRRR